MKWLIVCFIALLNVTELSGSCMRLRRMLRLAYNGSIQPYSSVNYTINNCLQLCLHLLYACEWVGYKNNECNIFSERPSVQIAFVPHTEIFEKSVDGCTATTAVSTITDVTASNTVASTDAITTTCFCPCSKVGSMWSFLDGVNFTKNELRKILTDELEQLRRELEVDTKKTNSYYRTHHSASDNRMSAVSTGVVGVILLCIPFILIVTIDLLSFKRCFYKHK